MVQEKEIHVGENLRDLRDLLGIKQDVVAKALNVTQQRVSSIEKEQVVAPEILETYSKILNIPVEAIKKFSKDKVVNIIATTFTNTNHDNSAFIQHNPVFNPIDKIVELFEKEVARLKEEITQLKEELVKQKGDKPKK